MEYGGLTPFFDHVGSGLTATTRCCARSGPPGKSGTNVVENGVKPP
jgi:hypothetical protein